jgi:hypothetical protein
MPSNCGTAGRRARCTLAAAAIVSVLAMSCGIGGALAQTSLGFPEDKGGPPPGQPSTTSDAVAPCRLEDQAQRIQSCSALIGSGSLSGASLAEAYDLRGDGYKSTKQLQMAVADYSRAIELAPAVAVYLNDRGRRL